MSAFDELALLESRSSNQEEYKAMALLVEGYDLSHEPHAVIGRLLGDNGKAEGDQVRVVLRPDERAAMREHARAEIKDLANEKSRAYAQHGAIVFFNYVYPGNEPGLYTAGWVEVASHFPQQAIAARYWVNLVTKNRPDKVVCYVNYFKTGESTLIASETPLEDLEKVIAEQLTSRNGAGIHRFSAVRLVNPAGQTVVAVANTQWERQDGAGWPQPLTGELCVEQFKQSDEWRLIQQAFAENSVAQCEVIPGARLFVGEMSKTKILGNEKRREYLGRLYRGPDDQPMYIPAWIAARMYDDESGRMFVTHVRPSSGRPPRYRLSDLPTPHFHEDLSRAIPMAMAPQDTVQHPEPGHGPAAPGPGEAPQRPAPAGSVAGGGNEPAPATWRATPPASTASGATSAPPQHTVAGGAQAGPAHGGQGGRPFQAGAEAPGGPPPSVAARRSPPPRAPAPAPPPPPIAPASAPRNGPHESPGASGPAPETGSCPPNAAQTGGREAEEAEVSTPASETYPPAGEQVPLSAYEDEEIVLDQSDLDAINSLAPSM